MNFNFINPFSKEFLQPTPEQSYINSIASNQNSVGKDEDGINWSALLPSRVNGFFDPSQPCDSNGILFDAVFATKQQRISFYRSMALYPIVKQGLSTITNEIVCANAHGNYIKFRYKRFI